EPDEEQDRDERPGGEAGGPRRDRVVPRYVEDLAGGGGQREPEREQAGADDRARADGPPGTDREPAEAGTPGPAAHGRGGGGGRPTRGTRTRRTSAAATLLGLPKPAAPAKARARTAPVVSAPAFRPPQAQQQRRSRPPMPVLTGPGQASRAMRLSARRKRRVVPSPPGRRNLRRAGRQQAARNAPVPRMARARRPAPRPRLHAHPTPPPPPPMPH